MTLPQHSRAARRGENLVSSPLAATLAAAAVLAGAAIGANALLQRRTNARHPAKGRFVEVDGLKVHYLEKGTGSPIVLIHGNAVTAEDFVISGLFDSLARNHRVVAFDRPGFGHTARPRNRMWTARAQADLLLSAMAALDIDRPLVVGHSWGALAALTMAVEEPEAILGLVLMSGYYRPTPRLDVPAASGPAIPILGDLMRYTVSPLLGWIAAPLMARGLFAPAKPTERFRSKFPLAMTLRPSQIRASAGDAALMIPGAAGLARRAGEFAAPVLIIAGEGDRIVSPRHQSEGLARKIQGSRLRLVPGAGHMVHHTAAEEVARAVREFADQIEAGATSGASPGASSGASSGGVGVREPENASSAKAAIAAE